MMEQEAPPTAGPVHQTDLEIDRGHVHEDYFGTEDWRRATVARIEQKLMTKPAVPLA